MKKLLMKENNIVYKIKKIIEEEFDREKIKTQVRPRKGKWVKLYYPVGGKCYYALGGKVIKRRLKNRVLNKNVSVEGMLSKERTKMMIPMGAPHSLLIY